jgi:hypothetical protein
MSAPRTMPPLRRRGAIPGMTPPVPTGRENPVERPGPVPAVLTAPPVPLLPGVANERQAMTRGDGSLIYATRAGVAVSGVLATVPTAPPAPATWAHCEACGWVAAWVTARGRHMIGPRQLLAGVEWQGQVRWREHGSERVRGHRPDLLAAITPDGPLMAVEVELATKSHARLHAVLALHARWVASGKARALIYVCGDTQLADRVRGTAEPLGLNETRRTLRIELLDVVRDAATDPQPARERVR